MNASKALNDASVMSIGSALFSQLPLNIVAKTGLSADRTWRWTLIFLVFLADLPANWKQQSDLSGPQMLLITFANELKVTFSVARGLAVLDLLTYEMI